MFHVEEVTGVGYGGELAVVEVVAEDARVGGGGVFVVFAVDEH